MKLLSKKTGGVALAVCALAFFCLLAIHAMWYAPDSEIAVPSMATSTLAAASSKPVRIRIPSLAIDAAVQAVGVTSKDTMGVPSNFIDTAWYKYGPTPGEVGSAVIDGHVDNGLALPGVFKKLATIELGADVYIRAADGSLRHFKVVEKETYPYGTAPTERVFKQADAARLNLITCGGVWDAHAKTYTDRLIVYTKLIDSATASTTSL